MNFKKIYLMILIATATSFMGQVYLNPFNSGFRVSLGIVILSVFILKYKEINILYLNIFTGLLVVLFRVLLDYSLFQFSFVEILLNHLPSISFYILFGLSLSIFDIRKYIKTPLLLFSILSFCDLGSNIVETAIRFEFEKVNISTLIYSLFLTAIIRSLITLILYSSINVYTFLTIKEEQNRHYKELLIFTSNLKSELFFLNKSKNNIEKAMEKAYLIYSNFSDNLNREEVLDLAKDIHEIKKDYNRVLLSIENTITFNKYNSMKLSQILELIKDNNDKFIKSIDKKIEIKYKINYDLKTKYYYELISILNNLISNSIDAIDTFGIIDVTEYMHNDCVFFEVKDNGKGLKFEDKELIFNPGFTTKFDQKTGKMSTGIGLTHVKNIVEDILNGHIDVSILSRGVKFTISIPLNVLKESD